MRAISFATKYETNREPVIYQVLLRLLLWFYSSDWISLVRTKEVLRFLLWLDNVNGFPYVKTITKQINEAEIEFAYNFTVIIGISYHTKGLVTMGRSQLAVRRPSTFEQVCHLLLIEVIVP